MEDTTIKLSLKDISGLSWEKKCLLNEILQVRYDRLAGEVEEERRMATDKETNGQAEAELEQGQVPSRKRKSYSGALSIYVGSLTEEKYSRFGSGEEPCVHRKRGRLEGIPDPEEQKLMEICQRLKRSRSNLRSMWSMWLGSQEDDVSSWYDKLDGVIREDFEQS